MKDLNKIDFKILIVDDNEANRFVAFHAIRKYCKVVDFAEDGAIAVKKAGKGNYDIILMDIAMPNMDGITATAMIRANSALAKQPLIIGITAFTEYTDDCIESGMQKVINKPYRINLLTEEIFLQYGIWNKNNQTSPNTN